MKKSLVALVIFAAGCAGAGHPPQAPPASAGSAVATASTPAAAQETSPAPAAAAKKIECAVIEAKTEPEGLREEGRWLHEHYPGWKKLRQSLGMGEGGRHFDYLTIAIPSGEEVSLCFDITSFFGKF